MPSTRKTKRAQRALAAVAAASLLLGALNQAFDVFGRVARWVAPDEVSPVVGPPLVRGLDNGMPTTCRPPSTDLHPEPVPPSVADMEGRFLRLRISPRSECDTVWALTTQPRARPCHDSGRNCVWVWVVRRSDNKESKHRRQFPGTHSVFSFHLENDGGDFKGCVARVDDPNAVFCTEWTNTRL